ncbi:hypothetical protein AVEN_172743-1 [Araneus ventricosus]|uniref:Uncharacterized protein n=1 Tax=Araneus ventricosus TaxID=182803 RepID=A0A4Y2BIC4_ARAVE|nr:hypothetical protein AVEN_172743-1 [Araneus ventricosus]
MWLLGKIPHCQLSFLNGQMGVGRRHVEGGRQAGSLVHLAPRSDVNICLFGFLEGGGKKRELVQQSESAADVFEVGRNPIQVEKTRLNLRVMAVR